MRTLPVETIHEICTLVGDEDLRNLQLVNRALVSIASDVYAQRLGPRRDPHKSTVTVKGTSYRALGAWKRSRLFSSLKDGVQLYCLVDSDDSRLAESQVTCLRQFLSTYLPTNPLSSIVINGVCHLPPADIANFIQLIDKAGCSNASIMSPYEFDPRSTGATCAPCPPVKLLNLRRLQLDTSYFVDDEWSAILRCLSGSRLAKFSVRGPLPFISLLRFIGRHPDIESLESYCRWALLAENSPSGVPQRIVTLPKLEKLDGPPSHVGVILKSLVDIPKKLSLVFHPDPRQSYSQFVIQIMEIVRLCDGLDSQLDIVIHFSAHHFKLEHNYKFDVDTMKALGVKCPGTKSLYISLPALNENDIEVSTIPSLKSRAL